MVWPLGGIFEESVDHVQSVNVAIGVMRGDDVLFKHRMHWQTSRFVIVGRLDFERRSQVAVGLML